MGLDLEAVYGKHNVSEQPVHEYTEYKAEQGFGWGNALPAKQGLYDPELEKDACGVGFAAYVLEPLRPCDID